MKVAVIKGDGIGADVTEAALAVVHAASAAAGAPSLSVNEIHAGADYFADKGRDIEPGGEEEAGKADAIFLGAIGLPSIRHTDGTEISPHLRLRNRFGLYAGVRPVKGLYRQTLGTNIRTWCVSLQTRSQKVATPAGLEPATVGLEVRCSIQLSYGAILSSQTINVSRACGGHI